MSLVEKEINKVLENLFEGYGTYINRDFCSEYFYPFFNQDEEEIELELEEIIEQIFNKYNISQYDIDIEEMFENSGLTIDSFSVCWLENNKLYSILNIPIESY